MNNFDFIILGAGSAGCVLGNRLSEENNDKILLLENGGSDKSPLIQMPAALSYPMNMKKYDWGFESEPEINLNNRKDHPLNVVRDPQKPTPKINLYLLDIFNALIKPNKKQPMILIIKVSSICHRNKAPRIAPKDIKKNVLFLISIPIY